MIKILKSIIKIVITFLIFFFVINFAEFTFDIELDSYYIVILFILVASSTGMFNIRRNKKKMKF